jgi:hypothetical protein
MSYTAATLITKAWYLSNIVSRDYETVGKDALANGLELLNALLASMTLNNKLIPYYQEYDVAAVTGVEKFFVPNLVEAETLTFSIGQVRYASAAVARKAYFGTARVGGVNALPFCWHAEKTLGGTNIYLYYLPSAAYDLKVWGKFALGSVTIDQDLSLTLDDFYIEYLRYALASYMCAEEGLSFPPSSQKMLDRYEARLSNFSPVDLTMTKVSPLSNSRGISMPINLFNGWMPS